MSLLVMLTGSVGFITSYGLLQAGMTDMPWRYFLSSCSAYAIFMVLLWIWLRTRSDDYTEIPDLTNAGDLIPSSKSQENFDGLGGHFGGGGSSGTFETSATDETPVTSAADLISGAAEAEELAIPLVLIALTGALLLSSLFIVYSSPMLFAELLVDGVLAARLYGHLHRMDSQHWLETAFRRTFWPFAITALLAVSCGAAIQHYAPTAKSVGDALLLIEQTR